MAEVKWIKLTTDMFDNRKIRHLRKLPEGSNIVLIWIMLLTMAGRCNANGMIFLTENIPYTTKMLADELDFEENTVKLALDALCRLGMVVMDENRLIISGWEEHQNIEGMDKIREQNRLRQKRWYENQKSLPNVIPNVSITQPNAIDIEEDKEKDIEIDKENNTSSSAEDVSRTDVQRIMNSWNRLPVPHITRISGKRNTYLKARIREYSVDDVLRAIENVNQSSFLKGEKGFIATFDWFIKPSNFQKVLEGNYCDRGNRGGNTGNRKNAIYGSGELGAAELEAIDMMMGRTRVNEGPPDEDDFRSIKHMMGD